MLNGTRTWRLYASWGAVTTDLYFSPPVLYIYLVFLRIYPISGYLFYYKHYIIPNTKEVGLHPRSYFNKTTPIPTKTPAPTVPIQARTNALCDGPPCTCIPAVETSSGAPVGRIHLVIPVVEIVSVRYSGFPSALVDPFCSVPETRIVVSPSISTAQTRVLFRGLGASISLCNIASTKLEFRWKSSHPHNESSAQQQYIGVLCDAPGFSVSYSDSFHSNSASYLYA